MSFGQFSDNEDESQMEVTEDIITSSLQGTRSEES